MDGIERITARIEADAAADAERIAQEAREQCAAIASEGEAKAQERYWRKLNEGARSVEERAHRLRKAADMEARKSILSFKQSKVDEAFQRAEKRLCALPRGKYIEFLAELAARASVTGREQIVLSEADREKTLAAEVLARANKLLKTRGNGGTLTLAAEGGSFSGGLILRDGSVSVNCTIEELIGEARQKLAAHVAEELFS